MKVIRTGYIDKKTKRFECEKCHCIFEADSGEYELPNQMEYLHDGVKVKCTCPYCGNKVYKHSD